MTWFKVDDKLHGHVKARRAGVAAMGLWALAGSYCADHRTNGVVAAEVVEALAGDEGVALAARLVVVGLWVAGDTGWRFHDWADYQPQAVHSSERVAEVSRKRAEAGRKSGAARRANKPRTNDEQTANKPAVCSEQTCDKPPTPLRNEQNRTPVPDPDIQTPCSPPLGDAPARVETPKPPAPPTGAPHRGQLALVADEPPPSDVAAELFDLWRRTYDHPRSTLDDKRRRRIERAVKTCGADRVRAAILGAQHDDWLMGRDPKSPRRYDGLETILRDAAQVERLADLHDREAAPPPVVAPPAPVLPPPAERAVIVRGQLTDMLRRLRYGGAA